MVVINISLSISLIGFGLMGYLYDEEWFIAILIIIYFTASTYLLLNT